MDNKTASEWLESIKKYIHGGDEEFDRRRLEAIDVGIQVLKAQEPIKPKVDIDTWVCGNCGTRVEHQSIIGPNAVLAETFKFCPECGKPVKWK